MFKCGFYESEITPPLGCCIPGYYSIRYADGVRDKLYAKAMAVSNGKDTVVIMALDAISITDRIEKGILKRAAEYTGISEENMNVSSIHTHTGIPRGGEKDGVKLGDDEYEEFLIRIGADCMTLAYQNMEDAKIRFGKGQVDGIAFNRVYNMKGGSYQTAPEIGDENVLEPNGPIDPELAVLYVEDLKGNAKGTIINFACHPDVVKGTKYSGDWPSIVSYNMKDEYGRDFVSIFVNGTCGNINHVDVINAKEYPPSEYYITMGNTVAREALKAIKTSNEIEDTTIAAKKEFLNIPAREWDMDRIAWARNIVETVKPIEGLTLALGTGHQDQEDLCVAQGLLKSYEERVDSYKRGVGAIRIGDVYFFSLPSEPFVEFGLYIKENSPSTKNIVAELSHGAVGYIPLKHLVYDSVYESRRVAFPLQPGSGELIAETAVKLGKELAD